MKLLFQIAATTYCADTDAAYDLSIPLHFGGLQPRTYGVPGATARAYEEGAFVGDTRRGGGCNFETLTLTPHCNGTHTEGVGHIADARISVHTLAPTGPVPATLITLTPVPAQGSGEAYAPPFEPADLILSRRSLEAALNPVLPEFLDAVIIRTLPNDATKRTRDYLAHPPPFFSLDAMAYLCARGVRHLVVDLPSVDRTFDEGRLCAHHVFWEVPQGSHQVDPVNSSRKTITEMVYVAPDVPDGPYLLTLQLPSFVSDAAPSRPILYPVRPCRPVQHHVRTDA